MKKYLVGFWYSLPIQLFFLHFRRYQVFLVFWYILFATITGHFMYTYGAGSLFLAPEYFGKVNALSFAFVGFAIGVFVMGWNITTFILNHRLIRFLATNAQPFLKYCINNAILPLLFLSVYCCESVTYNHQKELMDAWQIAGVLSGFLGGFILAVLLGFLYFFGADKTIYRSMATVIDTANVQYALAAKSNPLPQEKNGMRVEWFLSAKFKLRKPRDVRHYSKAFLDSIFKRHHIAAVMAILLAFLCLIAVGFTGDKKLFRIPAAASITVFFSIVIAVAGAFSLFLKNWSIPALIIFYLALNHLYQTDVIDLRNKAYGLDYTSKTNRPQYTREYLLNLASDSNMQADKQLFIQRLEQWKKKQGTDKPVMYLINTSGGGIRSANFTFNVLQKLDTLMQGKLLQQTFFVNGASGGLLGAAYFRELYLQKQIGHNINLQEQAYVNDISKDLLNPLFSSFVSRDIIGPVQKFKRNGYEYIKDRGYAFEEKLNENTRGMLNKRLQDYKLYEDSAIIPTMFFNSVITQDGRKMIMCTQPVRFLMRQQQAADKVTVTDPDAIDFNSFFAAQNAGNVSVLSALRMNASFPYVLPSVWLPTEPVIDVMDAGLRDNYGQEITLRFMEVFRDWLEKNTSKVVVIQIRDRGLSDWGKPYENKGLINMLTTPVTLLQNNWFRLQDYYQHDQMEYLSATYGNHFSRICFQYAPSKKDVAASMSFHLTTREKNEIALSLQNQANQQAFRQILKN